MEINGNMKDATPTGRGNRLVAVRRQLSSTVPDEFRQGVEHLRKWFQDAPEDQEIYAFLVNTYKEVPTVQNSLLELLREMKRRGSIVAATTLSQLSTNEQDLMDEADDAYYAMEYNKAIQLYERILQFEPNNQQAKDRLVKAEAYRFDVSGKKPNKSLPREAVQWFRQARSYIAAKDFNSAITYLSAAIEEARAKEIYYSEAELLLNRIQNLFKSVDNKTKEPIPYRYDAFISYSSKDKDWVQNYLLSHLESRKIRVCIDFRDFEVGAPSITELERAVIQSHKTIAVLTPDYLTSIWTELEILLVATLDPTAHNRTLLPILLKKCELPLRMKALSYLDFTDPNNINSQLDRLVSSIK